MAINFDEIGSAVTEDLTVEKVYDRPLPREGIALLRLVGYIETGKHEPKNPQYNAALKCILIFELNHPDHLIELDGGEKVPQRMFIHLNKGRTEKSGYMKLFKVMNRACDNKHKHFVQMLGGAFIGEVSHNKSADGKTTYANLGVDGAWSMRKPVQTDVLTGTTVPVPVPEAQQELLGFLWENPDVPDNAVIEMWESLYIDGVRDNGTSKNWIQDTIMDNLEWEGSLTQSLTQEFVGLTDKDTQTEDELDGLDESDVPF